MITYSQFGKAGRLGNQLFQYASLLGMKAKYGCQLALPGWEVAHYFSAPFPALRLAPPQLRINEASFSYSGDEFDKHAAEYGTKVVDIGGWLQSEEYWTHCKADVLAALTFQPFIKDAVRHKFRTAFEKPMIAISVRRGDFVNNPNYALLPINYYLLALYDNFKDLSQYNIMVFSDDIPYCKTHFAGLENVFFAETSPIEQLCLGSHCRHFIISNSTFSWWMAYLGEKEGTKVIRPNYLFEGDLLRQHSDKDYWPKRWSVFDHKTTDGDTKKLDLRDVTFTIPVHFDHKDRRENLALNVCMLQRHFDTNIIVGEQGPRLFDGFAAHCRYHYFEGMKQFHRTKMLNEMAFMSETPIVVNWDADVFSSVCQIYESVRAIREGRMEVCYPFDGRMARVQRGLFQSLEKALDVGIFGAFSFRGTQEGEQASVGGAVFFNKSSFFDAGGEDEHYISYGPEDVSRFERFTRLGYKVGRIPGIIYHLDHFIGPNSGAGNPYFAFNHALLKKEQEMSKLELRMYVDSWPWKQVYDAHYYDTILEDAVLSWEKIWGHVGELEENVERVIDVGCGLGEAIFKLKEAGIEAYGVDHHISKEKLLINPCQYAEYDLTGDEPFPFKEKFDLVICAEVLEHIPDRYAEKSVQLLCELGDLVLFSAAIPGQGGHNHVNEQFQSYWGYLFGKNGFSPAACNLRELMYDDEEIEIWYRNNMILFAKSETASAPYRLDFVHPKLFTNVVQSLKHRK